MATKNYRGEYCTSCHTTTRRIVTDLFVSGIVIYIVWILFFVFFVGKHESYILQSRNNLICSAVLFLKFPLYWSPAIHRLSMVFGYSNTTSTPELWKTEKRTNFTRSIIHVASIFLLSLFDYHAIWFLFLIWKWSFP